MPRDRKLPSALLYSGPLLFPQHASSDVEKMILGNKCDMTDRRQVSKDRGEKVRQSASVKVRAGRQAHAHAHVCLPQLAIDYGVKFLETSAKSSLNVEEVSGSAEPTRHRSLELELIHQQCVFFSHLRPFIPWRGTYYTT